MVLGTPTATPPKWLIDQWSEILPVDPDTGQTRGFGSRCGAKTCEFGYPTNLPPGPLQQLINMRVLSVETVREDCYELFSWNNVQYQSCIWREQIEVQIEAPETQIMATFPNGEPAILTQERYIYLGTLTNRQFLLDFFQQQCRELEIKTYCWDEDIRVCRRGNLMFAFNYSEQQKTLPLDSDTIFLIGDQQIPGHGVSVWRDICD